MLVYYNERASEYEEAYRLGTGTASITDPTVFTTEIGVLERIVRGFGKGHLLDLACGTGYWLPLYIGNCSRVTLFDQSERMLSECELKVHDCALVGFLLSHTSEAQEHLVMQVLRNTLRRGAGFLILESAWTDIRARANQKVEQQTRRLNDGTAFQIYKRYISREDIGTWDRRYGLRTTIEHFGKALCAVSAAFIEIPG